MTGRRKKDRLDTPKNSLNFTALASKAQAHEGFLFCLWTLFSTNNKQYLSMGLTARLKCSLLMRSIKRASIQLLAPFKLLHFIVNITIFDLQYLPNQKLYRAIMRVQHNIAFRSIPLHSMPWRNLNFEKMLSQKFNLSIITIYIRYNISKFSI